MEKQEKSLFFAIFFSTLIGVASSLAVTFELNLGLWVLIPAVPLFSGLAYLLYDLRGTVNAVCRAAHDVWHELSDVTRTRMNRIMAWRPDPAATRARLLILSVGAAGSLGWLLFEQIRQYINELSLSPLVGFFYILAYFFHVFGLLGGCGMLMAIFLDPHELRVPAKHERVGLSQRLWEMFLLFNAVLVATIAVVIVACWLITQLVCSLPQTWQLLYKFVRQSLIYMHCEARRICFAATALGLTGGVIHGYVYGMILPSTLTFALIGATGGALSYRYLRRPILTWQRDEE